MNKILRFKGFLLGQLSSFNESIKIAKILSDTKYLLYSFRQHHYVDPAFNSKVSNFLISNLEKYTDQIDQMKMIRLFIDLHLKHGLTVSSNDYKILTTHVEKMKKFPNFRWLLDILILNHHAGRNDPALWKIVENAYISKNFMNKDSILPVD